MRSFLISEVLRITDCGDFALLCGENALYFCTIDKNSSLRPRTPPAHFFAAYAIIQNLETAAFSHWIVLITLLHILIKYTFCCLITSPARAVAKYCGECDCLCICVYVCSIGYLRNLKHDLYHFLCTLPVSVARSSPGMLMTGRIAYRRERGDGSAQRGRSVIYSCIYTCMSFTDATFPLIFSGKYHVGLSCCSPVHAMMQQWREDCCGCVDVGCQWTCCVPTSPVT